MKTVFPDGSGLFRQGMVPGHIAKMIQEWFGEHKKFVEFQFQELKTDFNLRNFFCLFPTQTRNCCTIWSTGDTPENFPNGTSSS